MFISHRFTNRLIKFIAFSLVLATLIGCGESDSMKLLAKADAIMEVDSERAKNILETIRTEDLNNEETAFYALLFTQAQIKNREVVDSDTLISCAYDYYKDRDDGDRTIRALFYEAKVTYNSHDLRKTMRDGLAAYEMSKETDNPFWIAKSAQLLGDVFFDVYNYPMAEKYAIETAQNFRRVGHVTNERYAIVDLAIVYTNANNEPRAIEMLDSLLSICLNENPRDSNLINYIQWPYLSTMVDQKRYQEMDSCVIDEIFKRNAGNPAIEFKTVESDMLAQENKYDEADEILSRISPLAKTDEDKLKLFYSIYITAKETNRYKEAVDVSDSIIHLQSKVAQNILFQVANSEMSDFYRQKSIDEKKRSSQLKLIYTFCILVAILIIIALVYYYFHKMRLKRSEIEAALSSILRLREQTENYYLQNRVLNERLENETELNKTLKYNLKAKHNIEIQNNEIILRLFQNQWATLNKLCDEYLDKQAPGNDRNLLFKNITHELNRLKSPENIGRIEKDVNEFMDGIMIKLRSQFPSFKESDYTFLMLNYAGLSPRAICIFTDIKYKTFQNKRLRLRKKIEASEVVDKNLFIEHIG